MSTKNECDKVVSKIVRSIGYCVRCGDVNNLTCYHFVPRRFNATRTNIDNVACVCLGCHSYLNINPRLHDAFVISLIGQAAYDALKRKAQTVTRIDWNDELIRLKKLLTQL